MGFYTIFEQLCKEKGVTPARVREDLAISQSTMASWKSRGLTPKYDTSKKLADYFGVSVDYLLGNVTEPFFHLDNQRIIREINSYSDDDLIPQNRISAALSKLNEDGQRIAADRVEELTEIPKYQRTAAQDGAESTPAPQEGNDTTPDKKPPESP